VIIRRREKCLLPQRARWPFSVQFFKFNVNGMLLKSFTVLKVVITRIATVARVSVRLIISSQILYPRTSILWMGICLADLTMAKLHSCWVNYPQLRLPRFLICI